jgi:hypothetical protein
MPLWESALSATFSHNYEMEDMKRYEIEVKLEIEVAL